MPENPKHAEIDRFGSLWFLTVFLLGFGSVFFSFGAVPLYLNILETRKEAWLRTHGIRIEARVIEVRKANYSVNRVTPWIVHCQWEDPDLGTQRVFKSRAIFTIEPPAFAVGDFVGVLIDRNQPNTNYFVDVAGSLQERAIAA